jgi:hypothetical protein
MEDTTGLTLTSPRQIAKLSSKRNTKRLEWLSFSSRPICSYIFKARKHPDGVIPWLSATLSASTVDSTDVIITGSCIVCFHF